MPQRGAVGDRRDDHHRQQKCQDLGRIAESTPRVADRRRADANRRQRAKRRGNPFVEAARAPDDKRHGDNQDQD